MHYESKTASNDFAYLIWNNYLLTIEFQTFVKFTETRVKIQQTCTLQRFTFI